jgi:rSAM/selenodomain-associated transferase 1
VLKKAGCTKVYTEVIRATRAERPILKYRAERRKHTEIRSPCTHTMKLEILTSARRNPAVTDKCAMGIMIKAPQAGFSKTRLSPPLSLEEAASISRCFLKDTTAAIDALSQEDPFVSGVAIYTPVGSEADFAELLPRSFKMIAQRDGGFGTRLLGAAEDLFSVGFSAVCLIDSDSPTLPFHCLRDVSTFLKEPKDRMVIGPCWDGGYYLLGLRHAHTRLFEDINWNTDRVYGETVERSKEINLPAIILPAWYDVDDQLSLNRLLSELFPERANEAVPLGSPALYTQEFLRQILAKEGNDRIWPQTSTLVRTV